MGKHETLGEIKCRPTIDPKTGLVWFGSYDHHIYCVDASQTPPVQVFKEHLGASVFAACVIDADRRRLFVCITNGLVKALGIESMVPECKWSINMKKPVFSTPYLDPASGDIIFGCLDACLHRISGNDGTRLWSTHSGPMFSSPRLWNKSFLIVGTHAKKLMIVDQCTGEIV